MTAAAARQPDTTVDTEHTSTMEVQRVILHMVYAPLDCICEWCVLVGPDTLVGKS